MQAAIQFNWRAWKESISIYRLWDRHFNDETKRTKVFFQPLWIPQGAILINGIAKIADLVSNVLHDSSNLLSSILSSLRRVMTLPLPPSFLPLSRPPMLPMLPMRNTTSVTQISCFLFFSLFLSLPFARRSG